MEILTFLYTASAWVVPVLVAITMHEAAHGYVAWRLGDDTAYQRGRVTFNPFKHIDAFGTVVLPALLLLMRAPFLFGWAKPVPVTFGRLRHPRQDMVLVAAAGPGMNILLAVISAILVHVLWLLPEAVAYWTAQMLYNSILLNLVLAIFNMLPLPPMDGGRVATGLLPLSFARPLAQLEPYGMLILIGLIFVLPLIGAQLGLNLNVFYWLVWTPVSWLLPFFLAIAGMS